MKCPDLSDLSAPLQAKTLRKPAGIALLLTLVILLLVTIFMTEFFFETTLELRAIENFKSTFVAQSVVKSMFKAVLEALSFNETLFFQQLREIYRLTGSEYEISFLDPPDELFQLPAGIIPAFDGATFYTPYIRPIDHLFNLNRIQTRKGTRAPDTPLDRVVFNQFVNLVAQIPIEIPPPEDSREPPEYRFLELADIAPIYAAIFDWMDAKDDGALYASQSGVEGAEEAAYLEFAVDPPLSPKNRRFDRVSELKLVAGVIESEIPYRDWKKHFTIYDVGTARGLEGFESRLNVNLANKDEIEMFLRRFEQNTQYYGELDGPPENQEHLQEFAENAEAIATALVFYDEAGERFHYPDFRTVDQVLRPLDLTKRNYRDFFILYSNWYEVRLVAEAVGIQAEIIAVVYVPRDQDGDATGKPVIKDFILR